MITSKQRAKLRGLANPIPTIFQIGKDGVGDNLIKQLDDALEARELIKIHILDSSFLDPKETLSVLCEELGAEPVQTIGSRIVLYRASKDHKTIEI
ncbi:MAG: ribosome assembly RNA-binding protein YhbY [Clostridia bacterium]|nr:ribosome assembly RNA-binding protein YhbY [Clostridia bacterium]MBQ3553976.1 ribosome assembly RNA-binding protein YhbY [Clostridia bacterium]